MLAFKTQTELIDAAAAMMRTCAIAATNALAQSASERMKVWTGLLDGSVELAAAGRALQAASPFAPLTPRSWTAAGQAGAGPGAWHGAWDGPWRAWPWAPHLAAFQLAAPHPGAINRQPPKPAVPAPAPADYSTYRSAGGHASTQVITAPLPPAAHARPSAEAQPAAAMLGVPVGMLMPMQAWLAAWCPMLGA